MGGPPRPPARTPVYSHSVYSLQSLDRAGEGPQREGGGAREREKERTSARGRESLCRVVADKAAGRDGFVPGAVDLVLVPGSGFRVQGLGFRVNDSGFRV